MEFLEFAESALEGAFEAALEQQDAIELLDSGIIGGEVLKPGFVPFGTDEFPAIDSHVFQAHALGRGLGLPFGFEVLAELVELLVGFMRENDLTGTEPMFESVEADGGLTGFGDRAVTELSVFAV